VRIRAIAGVGVSMCVAVTTFSIYLGIVEHTYSPRTRDPGVVTVDGRLNACPWDQVHNNLTTTTGVPLKVTSCVGTKVAGR
jgi:hypothetical protein